jgi:Tfp pilus assembly protein PilO
MKLQSINLNSFKRPAVLITIAAVILVAALWWFLWMQPEGNKLSTAQTQETQYSTTLNTLKDELIVDRNQAAKVKQYAGYLTMFSAAVPPIPEAPQLTTELANLADTTNVKLTSLSDDTTLTGTPLSTIPLSMDVQGGRQACIAFLQGLYNSNLMPRLITVDSITPSPVRAGNVDVLTPSNAQYNLSISATAYFDPSIYPSAPASATSTTTTTTTS